MTDPWDLIKKQLQAVLSAESFQNWFARTQLAYVDGRVVYVTVPERQTQLWLQNEYADLVQSAARSLGLGLERVAYRVQKEENSVMVEVDPRSELRTSI